MEGREELKIYSKCSLNEVPYTLYLNIIIHLLNIEDVGALCIVSKTLKEIFDNNEIWKYLYIKTTPLKIIDTSVHIGTHDKNDIQKYNKIDPVYFNDNHSIYTNFEALSHGYNICGCNKLKYQLHSIFELKDTLNIREHVIDHAPFIKYQPKIVTDKYYEYIFQLHKSNAIKNKLSTINLCQKISHYNIDTLEYNGSKINYKSYKKKIIQKLVTDKMNKLKNQKSVLKKKVQLLKNAKIQYLKYLNEETELRESHIKYDKFIKKGTITIDLIDKKNKQKIKNR